VPVGASENDYGAASMAAMAKLNITRCVVRHFTRPGFIVSSGVLLCSVVAWWIIDHDELKHSYDVDKYVLILGVIISSLLYVSFSLWETLKKDLLALQSANRSLVEQQALLQISQLRSQHLFETNPHPMWFFDLETLRFVDVNEAAVRSYGYSREEFLAMTVLDIRPAEDRQRFLDVYNGRAEKFGQPGYWRHLHKDGRLVFVEISTYRQVIGGRELELVLANDATAEVIAEEALRRSEASFRSFVDNAPYGIFRAHVDEDRFLEINPALVRMLGYESPDEIWSLKISTGIYEEPNRLAEVLEELCTRGSVQAVTVQFRKKNGEKIDVLLSGRICRDSRGDLILFEGFMEDVTERKKLEDQLRQSQKMDAIGRLAGGIAHDFNNMLTAVIGYADLLAVSPGLSERQEKHVVQISKAAHRAASLTQQLLAFSRQQVLQPTPMDINTAIEDTLAMINRLLGEHIIVSFEAEPDVPLVFVDASQVIQILMNLCLNARDAMPRGGFLRIMTETESVGGDGVSENPELRPGSYVRISIADTGAGMPPEVQAKIFEPFFTTKGLGKGTGLGLATVYGLVQQSGGHISVFSQVGVGTCFNIYLPAVKGTGFERIDAGEQLSENSSGLPTIANGV